jgi:tetratricopeptide (TPR) repeat protein
MGQAQVPIWNVPYQRNLLFTGREDVLKKLFVALREGKKAALAQPQAISGLGGIGKTQTAVEYAYRCKDDYKAILWVKAETDGSIISDFVTIANLLDLPEKQEQDQYKIVEAVKRWFLEHSGWLVIFDNADDLAMVRDFLPQGDKGHILLTTRAHATGRIAQRIEVEKMEPEEGAIFLLHRATILDPEAPLDDATKTDRDTAKEIVQAMDGLPLALEQAGAYIEETECGLQGYLELYRAQGVRLLKEHGEFVPDHPKPVATTWSLSFERVEQANAAAAELLRFCAFLAPDAISEELFAESAAELGPTLEPVAADPSRFNAAIRELLKYSLVQRDPEAKTLSIHRLVQEVLKDQMDQETQRLWAERAVRAVSRVFPYPEFTKWDRCRRYLLHAQVCSAHIDEWNLLFTEAARLLNFIGTYLWYRGEYEQVESLHQRALAIREVVLGPEHAHTATSLNELAVFYDSQGKYEEAEPLQQRALSISEKALGPDHPTVAIMLNVLANLYYDQGKYLLAEPLYQRALAISEKALGPDHPTVAIRLNNLAVLYSNQGKYEEAEPLNQRALEIKERILGSDHPSIATGLNNLANLYSNQGKYEKAEPLFQRALAIYDKALPSDHPSIALTLENYANLLRKMHRIEEASKLEQRAREIRAKRSS